MFRLSGKHSLQVIQHTAEQPQFAMIYFLPAEKPVTAKVYIMNNGEHCTMLLAEEY